MVLWLPPLAGRLENHLKGQTMTFHKDVLTIDPASVAADLTAQIKHDVRQTLRRSGAVVGISGGVDSSVVVALCVLALGSGRVLGLMLPEKESSPKSIVLARKVADRFGIETRVEDLTGALVGLGCYTRRDQAIQAVFPEYDPSYKAKITLPGSVLDSDKLNVFHLTIISPKGNVKSKRLNVRNYLQIVGASNFKQRSRMAMLYYHAELRNYAVIGTPNKNEHDQGFFVKWGDGGYDVGPIRHLYKTQVYQLADYLEIPAEICQAAPTTDTYSAPSSQEEFFFRMPFEVMDLLWYALEHNVPASQTAQVMGLTEKQVQRAFADLLRKQRTTEYLRTMPLEYG
jgi:NAD+ synthase